MEIKYSASYDSGLKCSFEHFCVLFKKVLSTCLSGAGMCVISNTLHYNLIITHSQLGGPLHKHSPQHCSLSLSALLKAPPPQE